MGMAGAWRLSIYHPLLDGVDRSCIMINSASPGCRPKFTICRQVWGFSWFSLACRQVIAFTELDGFGSHSYLNSHSWPSTASSFAKQSASSLPSLSGPRVCEWSLTLFQYTAIPWSVTTLSQAKKSSQCLTSLTLAFFMPVSFHPGKCDVKLWHLSQRRPPVV